MVEVVLKGKNGSFGIENDVNLGSNISPMPEVLCVLTQSKHIDVNEDGVLI
jgi:hypothetical protein